MPRAHATTGEGLLGIVQFAGGNRLPLGGFEIAIDADRRQPDGTAVGTTLADFNLDVEVSATSFSGAGAFALPPAEGAGRPSAWTRTRVSAIAVQRQRLETPTRARHSSRIPRAPSTPWTSATTLRPTPSVRSPASWRWTGRISAPRCPRTTTPGRSCPAARRAKRVGASYRDGSISLWRRASWKRWEASPPIARWRPHSALPADAPVDGQVMSVHLS